MKIFCCSSISLDGRYFYAVTAEIHFCDLYYITLIKLQDARHR
jgi:hypothetical protein